MSSAENYLDDPRLTAYALDELPADERAEVDALLADAPEARAVVAEIQQLSVLLRETNYGEPASGYANELRASVEAKLDAASATRDTSVPTPAPNSGRSGSNLVAIALAASLLIAVSVVLFGRLGDFSNLTTQKTAVVHQPLSSDSVPEDPLGELGSNLDRSFDDIDGLSTESWDSTLGGVESTGRIVTGGDSDRRYGNTIEFAKGQRPAETPGRVHEDGGFYYRATRTGEGRDEEIGRKPGEADQWGYNPAPSPNDSSRIHGRERRAFGRSEANLFGDQQSGKGDWTAGGISGGGTWFRSRGEGQSGAGERYESDYDEGRPRPSRPASDAPIPPANGVGGRTDDQTNPPTSGLGDNSIEGENGAREAGDGDGLQEGGGKRDGGEDDDKLGVGGRPSDPADDAGGELDELRRRQQIVTAAIRGDVTKDLERGLELSETDPIVAETQLRLTLESLKDAKGIDQTTRERLTGDVNRALDFTAHRRNRYLAEHPIEESAQIEKEREELATTVEKYSKLVRAQAQQMEAYRRVIRPPNPALSRLEAQAQHLEGKLATANKLLDNHKKIHADGTTSWRRSRKVPNTSRLMIGVHEELPLDGMQVNVQIDGFRARVLLDCYFYNDHDRQLEGNFQLRLPNEASLYFFAFGETAYGPKGENRPQVRQAFFNLNESRKLGTAPAQIMDARRDSWKQPKEARMVTRTKAAHAYRETVRRRVDPALVEWSGAGVFSAKIFPLMPRKLHRVVIGYDVNLLKLGRDLVYRLDLPDKAGDCTVDLNVTAAPGTEAQISPPVKPFTAAGRAYFHYDRPQRRQFEVRLPNAGNVLIHGDDPDAETYFSASIEPELPAAKLARVAEQVVFMVDTSLSSNPDKFNVWLSLVKATLNNNRDAIKQFAVMFFNIEQHWWQQQFIANTPQQVEALGEYMQTLALEGATDLGQALRVATAPSWDPRVAGRAPDRDYFLLSDGAITWGERDANLLVRELGITGGLFAYRTGLAGTDVRTLTHLTRESGGAVFTVLSDAQIEAASKAHRQRPWQIVDVKIAGGTDLILAGRPRTLFDGQQLLLVGRGLPDDGAPVQIKIKRGKTLETISIPIDRRVASDLAPRTFGQVSVAGLEDLGDAAESIATAYARHFRITGRTCSLLMLESEEDYRRFDIKPEDDEFVVKSTIANEVILAAEDRAAATLGNPKSAFISWLNRLEKTPGLQFRLSPALEVALDGLPDSAFAVKGQPLSCNQRAWASMPKPLRQQLADRSFGYEDLMKEAEARRTRSGASDALRALSSLVEYRPGDLVLARDVGYSAMDWGLSDQAYHLLRRVAEARPYEPQTYLAIAQCLTGMNNIDLAMVYYEIVLNARWNDRFQEIHRIAGVDYLHFLKRIKDGSLSVQQKDFAMARLDALAREIDLPKCDVLVTVMWNTDGTDVDLHVTEPSGEACFYSHPTTSSGGHITADVTQGYGPEMYTLPNASAGNYKIQVKYFASDQNRLSTRTRVIARIYENWGTPQESVVRRTVTLQKGKEMTDIMTIKRGGK